MKHTPGPWKASEDFNLTGTLVSFIEGGGHSIAQTRLDDDTPEGMNQANARLIAAAPELLEACRDALLAVDTADWPTAQDNLIAAIAKAKGKD